MFADLLYLQRFNLDRGVLKEFFLAKATVTTVLTIINICVLFFTENAMKTIPENKSGDNVVSSCSVNFSQSENKVVEVKFNKTTHLADDLSNTHTKKSYAEKPKKKRYKMAAAIFAIFVLQFVWQFSFIQSEKLRNVEKTLKDIQLEELPAKIITKSVEVKTVFVEKKVEIAIPPKNILPIVYRQPEIKLVKPEIKPVQAEIKKKTPRKNKDERLRRAEQLLTGF